MRLRINSLPVSRCCEIIEWLEGKDLERLDWAEIQWLWERCKPALNGAALHPMARMLAIKAILEHSIWQPLSVRRFTSTRRPEYQPVSAVSSHPLIATLITERLVAEDRLDSISLERALQLVEAQAVRRENEWRAHEAASRG